MEITFRAYVLLSVQAALWDLVTPNLRGVSVRAEYPDVELRFLFENAPRELDLENASEAETLVMADFGDDVAVTAKVEHLPVSHDRLLAPAEGWVYLRQEVAG